MFHGTVIKHNMFIMKKLFNPLNKKGNTYDNGTYVIKVLKNRIITRYKQ